MDEFCNGRVSPPPPAAPVSTPLTDDQADTQCARGLWCANQIGEPKYAEAAVWYRKAADQGHSLAQFNLGVMYANGQGLDRDDVQAAIWFERAARCGDGGAQFNLGRLCHRASLDKRAESAGESRIEAYKWFRLASDQGYHGAGIALSMLFQGMSSEEVSEGNRRVAEVLALTA